MKHKKSPCQDGRGLKANGFIYQPHDPDEQDPELHPPPPPIGLVEVIENPDL